MASKKIGFSISIDGTDKLINNLEEASKGVKQLKKQLSETKDVEAYQKVEKELIKLTAEQKRLEKERIL